MKTLQKIITYTIKIAIPLLLLTAVVCTFLPIMSAYCGGDGESFTLVLRVINLAEFSAWGTVVVLSPLAFAAICYAKLDRKTKTLSLIGMYMFSSVAYVEAVKRAHEWLDEVSTGFVVKYPVMVIYPLVIFCVSVLMYADIRRK